MVLVIRRSTIIIQCRQHNQLHAAVDKRRKPLSHLSRIAPFIKVGHQYEHCILRAGHYALTISQSPGNIRPSAQLHPKKQIDRVLQIVRKVDNRRVKHDHSGRDSRNRRQYRTENAGVNHGCPHRTTLVQTQNDIFHGFPLTAVSDTYFRNNRLILRLVIFQVLRNGCFPVYFIIAGIPATGGAIQRTGHRLLGRCRQFAEQFINHPTDYLTRHLFILLRNHLT